jgi:hypothetical protein
MDTCFTVMSGRLIAGLGRPNLVLLTFYKTVLNVG